MKKIIIFLISILITTLIVVPVIKAQEYSYITGTFGYHSYFEYGKMQSKTFVSYTELNEYVNSYINYGSLECFDMDKYNNKFFEQKFIYLFFVDATSSRCDFKLTSIEETEDSIEVEIVRSYEEQSTSDMVSWFLILEMDNSLINKKVNVTKSEVDFHYTINEISLLSSWGENLTVIPQNSSFIVDVAVTKTQERDAKDFVFVAVYDTDGALLSLDYVKAKFPLNTECSFGFSVPAQEKQVGSIKAYVWNSFTSQEPLAESKTLTFE